MSRKFFDTISAQFRRQSIVRQVILGTAGIGLVIAAAWSLSSKTRSDVQPTPELFVTNVSATPAPSAGIPATDTTSTQTLESSGKVLIRWSIGIGTGGDPAQIPIENEVIADFNASQDKIFLVSEIIPSLDVLAIQMLSDGGPDIVGPVGWFGSNKFYGEWLDIGPYIQADHYDTSKFETALAKMYQSEKSTVGLPFAVYPSAIYYNTDLFNEAGLNPPPAKYGEKYKMPDGTQVEWNWDTVKWVAQMLTLDAKGNNALDSAFDKNNIVQYGFSFQWEDKPSYWGAFWQFGPEDTFLVPGGSKSNYQARIPIVWKEAWQWYYDGIWSDQPYIPNYVIEHSASFHDGNSFSSRKLGMVEMPAWYLCCVTKLEEVGGHFDFGAMPTYDGKVGGRVDADTFRIWKGTKHPQEAWEVMKYLVDVGIQKLVVGTPDKPPAYGAIPSISSLRDPWLTAAKAAHPSVKNWDVLLEGLNYPDTPSAEAYMPNMLEAWDRTITFTNLLTTTPNVDLDKESEILQNDLTLIFNK